MKIVIIEDEILSAERLKHLLLRIDNSFEIVKIIESISQGISFFESYSDFDLIFCDIQLSDGISLNIFDKIMPVQPIIFTTAYDEYALKAFSVNSIDYLLKPITLEKLEQSLKKYQNLKSFLNQNNPMNLEQIKLLMNNENSQLKKRFLVHSGNKIKPVNIDSIAIFFVENQLTYLFTNKGNSYSIDYSLDEIEKQVESSLFFRINRQMIVNISIIESFESFFNNRLILKTNPPFKDEIIVSKRKSAAFKDWIS